MTTAEFAGKAAGIIGVLAFFPYIWSILHGRTRPARSTWIVWTIVNGVLLFGFHAIGAGHAIWLALCYFAGSLITLTLSFKYGTGGWTLVDRWCLFGCAASLAAWAVLASPVSAMLTALIVDAFAATPTVVKAWRFPRSESSIAWSTALIANLLNLLAVPTWDLAHAAYPVYMVLLSGTLTGLALRIHASLRDHR